MEKFSIVWCLFYIHKKYEIKGMEKKGKKEQVRRGWQNKLKSCLIWLKTRLRMWCVWQNRTLRINDVFGFILLIHWRWTTAIYMLEAFQYKSFTLKKIKQAKKNRFLLVRILKVNESETECERYMNIRKKWEHSSKVFRVSSFFTLSCTWFWSSSIKGK